MSTKRQDLPSQLADARQQIKEAQAHITDLEARVFELQLASQSLQPTQPTEEFRQFLQSTLDAFPANTSVLAPDGTIIGVNLPWEQFADQNDGQSTTHYHGLNYLTVCDTAAGPMSDEAILAAAGIRAVIAGQLHDFYLEYPCNSPTKERWFMLRVTPFAEPAPRRVVTAHIDITERKHTEKAEREQRVVAETLRDSLAVLTASFDVETIMQKILAYSAAVIPSEAGTIMLYEGNQARVAYSRGYSPEAEAFFKDHRFPLNSELFTKESDDSRYYLVTDTKLSASWVSLPVTAWIRSSVGVPIVLRGKAIGLLVADSAVPNQFEQKDVKNLQAFARYAALALENAHHIDELEQRVHRRTSELQAAKERVEAILNNSADGILMVDSDFIIQQTNDAFNTLFGCETDTYFHQPLTTLFRPDSGDLAIKAMQRGALDGQGTNIEVCARRQDNTEFDAEFSIGFIKMGGFVCSIRDITERKQAEAALQKSAAEIHDLYNNAPCGYHSINKDGVIVQMNDTELRWLGYARDEMIDKLKITDIFTPESISIYKREYPGFMQRGWINDLELDLIRKDGSVLHILLNGIAIYDEHGQYLRSRTSVFDMTELRQAQLALRDSEARYRQSEQMLHNVIENIPVRLFWKGRNSVYKGCNTLHARHIGLESPYAIVGKTDFDISPGRAAHWVEQDRQVMESGAPKLNVEELIEDSDSSRHWLRSNRVVLRDAAEQADGVLVTIEDITTSKLAELAVAEERNLLRTLIDAVPDFIYIKDMQHRFMLTNTAHAQARGLTDPNEMTGKTDFDYFPAELAEQFRLEEATLLRTEIPLLNHEQTSFGNAGGFSWALSNKVPLRNIRGELIGIVGITRDITERKRAEAALKESEEQFRLLVETMQGGLATFDLNDRITYVNDRFCELLGYSRAEIIGTRSFDYVDKTDLEKLNLQFERRQHGEKTSYELTIRRKGGKAVNLLIARSPLIDKEGKLIGSIAVTTDITAQKQAELTLRMAFEKEKEIGELKSRFVSMASHEFRTPLATILATSESLSAYRSRMTEEQIDQRLKTIAGQVTHLRDIIEDVLQLSRLQARKAEFNPTMLDLNTLCRSVIDEFESRPEVKQRFVYSCNDTVRTMKLDKKLMRQIVSNLASNAVKYSPGDKTIYVSLEYTSDSLTLKVRDEGIGIPPADLKHLFEPFHRAGNVGAISGTGLGLTITKESIELHGGTIAVESKVDIGTTFTAHIPISVRTESSNH